VGLQQPQGSTVASSGLEGASMQQDIAHQGKLQRTNRHGELEDRGHSRTHDLFFLLPEGRAHSRWPSWLFSPLLTCFALGRK
jgi:hypothetical protein